MPNKIRCISPIDGSVFLERSLLGHTEALAATHRARTAQPGWALRKLEERVALVLAAVEEVKKNTEQMAVELAHQMGRPVRYGGEYSGFAERAKHMAYLAEDALAPIVVEESSTAIRRVTREPLGLVFVVAPWNYPYMTAINTLAPALIAGNVVILKHAAQTLLVGERLAQAFHAVGIPEDVLINVALDHDTTLTLIAEKAVDFVNFTGSLGAGQAIERAAAGTFIGVGTELGGKDAGYLREDGDLDQAVNALMDGALFNSGQSCCGIERIYVHESLFDAFLTKAISLVRKHRLGNPLNPEVTLGPMAHVRFAEPVRAQIANAIAAGAKAHIETFPQDDGAAYLSPQILTQVTHDMSLMRDESFGPVVGMMPVRDDEEAIALINDSEFGLTASIWTHDTAEATEIGARLEVGTVFMNRCDYLDPGLCWTGRKNTGRGGGLSVIGYHNLTRPKSYHLRKA